MRVDLDMVMDVWDRFIERANTRGSGVLDPGEVQRRFERRQRERIASGAFKGYKSSLAPQESTEAFSWPLSRRKPPEVSTISDDSDTRWVECHDDSSNQPYYWNTITQETTWTLPASRVTVVARSAEQSYGEQQVASSSIRITDGIRSLRAGVVRKRQGDAWGQEQRAGDERWIELWDNSAKESYYFSENTGHMQWEEPEGDLIELESPLKPLSAAPRTELPLTPRKEVRPSENESGGPFLSLLPSPAYASKESVDYLSVGQQKQLFKRQAKFDPYTGKRLNDGRGDGRSPDKLCYPAGFIAQTEAAAAAAAAVAAAAVAAVVEGTIHSGEEGRERRRIEGEEEGEEVGRGGGVSGGGRGGRVGRTGGEVGWKGLYETGEGGYTQGYHDEESGQFVHGYNDEDTGLFVYGYNDEDTGLFVYGYTETETGAFVHGYVDQETGDFVHGYFGEDGEWVAGYYAGDRTWISTAVEEGQYQPEAVEEGQYQPEAVEEGQYEPEAVEEGQYEPYLDHSEEYVASAVSDGECVASAVSDGGDGEANTNDWTEYRDDSEVMYWYSHTRGESTYEDPFAYDTAGLNTSATSATSADTDWSAHWDGDSAVVVATTPGGIRSSSADWIEIWDENQTPSWHNERTGETTPKNDDGTRRSAQRPLYEDMD
jgi:hypothetical protein